MFSKDTSCEKEKVLHHNKQSNRYVHFFFFTKYSEHKKHLSLQTNWQSISGGEVCEESWISSKQPLKLEPSPSKWTVIICFNHSVQFVLGCGNNPQGTGRYTSHPLSTGLNMESLILGLSCLASSTYGAIASVWARVCFNEQWTETCSPMAGSTLKLSRSCNVLCSPVSWLCSLMPMERWNHSLVHKEGEAYFHPTRKCNLKLAMKGSLNNFLIWFIFLVWFLLICFNFQLCFCTQVFFPLPSFFKCFKCEAHWAALYIWKVLY